MLTARDPANKTARLLIDQLWCVSDPEASGFETVLPSGRCQIIFSLAGMSLLDGASNGRPLAVFQGACPTPLIFIQDALRHVACPARVTR
ncbi:hypothetical protein AZF01_10875 [Martelella sp. AD-3]|nr:hypothetical protein AZF01_10875 [Martelella sp. AD-3]